MLPPGVGLVQCAAQTGRRDAEAFSGGRGGERLVEDQPGCLAGEGRAPRSYARLASGSACSSRSRRRAAPRLEALVGITRPDRSGWLGWHVYAAAGSPAGERRPVLHWHASMRLVRTSRHTKKVWTACSSGFRRLCADADATCGVEAWGGFGRSLFVVSAGLASPSLLCPRCGLGVEALDRFCRGCGAPLGAAASGHELRKTVTVVFCDRDRLDGAR